MIKIQQSNGIYLLKSKGLAITYDTEDLYWTFCEGDEEVYEQWMNEVKKYNGKPTEYNYISFEKYNDAKQFVDNFFIPQLIALKIRGVI